MVPLAGMEIKGGIMKQLIVCMSDIYGHAKFEIEVPEISREAILEGIKTNYHKSSEQIQHIMGGYVRVYADYPGKEVAHGPITYWSTLCGGGYRLDLEMRKAA